MDYKEKYNKLVEAIKVLQEANPSDEGIQNWVNDNVPELRESEDEMIRKKLIKNFKWFCGDFPETSKWGIDDGLLVKDVIAWLEKQGTSYTKRDVDNAYVEGMAFAKNELEKQGKQILANSAKTCKDEQKPAWDERDESHLIHCVRLINNAEGCSISEQENAITWLKSIKQRIGG